jgi:hypothetical protein
VKSFLEGVFPVAPVVPIRTRTVVGTGAVVGLGTALQILRLPRGIATNTVWADDGRGFLAQALKHGRVGSFAIPYNGYLVSSARVMAAVAASLPLRLAALVLSVGPALVVCLLAVLVYRSMRGHIPSRAVRFTFAAVMVLIPAVGMEIEANAANLHWYLDFAAVWVLLAVPPRWGERLAGAAVCFIAALSDPLVALLLPLAAIRMAATRSWRDLVAVAALLAGLAVQLPFILSAPSPQISQHPSIPDLSSVFAGHVLLPALVGGTIGQRLWVGFDWAAVIAAAVVVGGIAVALLRERRLRVETVVATGLFLLALAFTVVEVWARWDPVFVPVPGNSIETGARYWAVPSLLLWSAAALIAGAPRVGDAGASSGRGWARQGILLWLALLVAADFVALNPGRDRGPFWSDQVAAGARSCAAGAAGATLTTPPDPLWIVVVPCSLLRG